MNRWLAEQFGQPCRECGFDWGCGVSDALTRVASAPCSFRTLLAGRDGSERHPDLLWSAKAYVFHVADNLGIWAERLAAVLSGGTTTVVSYDENQLAEARGYEQAPVTAALWGVEQAVARWLPSARAALEQRIRLQHPQRGLLTADDVVLGNAHDTAHHIWDMHRCL